MDIVIFGFSQLFYDKKVRPNCSKFIGYIEMQ